MRAILLSFYGFIKFVKELQKDEKEYILSKQLIRSGTSIGANTEEAIAAESSNDFTHKLKISRKEARETIYWLRLIDKTYKIDGKKMIQDCKEILKILTSIIISTEKNRN